MKMSFKIARAPVHIPTCQQPPPQLAGSPPVRRTRLAPMGLLVRALLPMFLVALLGGWAHGQEGFFLSEHEAPAAVFPDADAFARRVIEVSAATRARMRSTLGPTEPSVWEDAYVTFAASRQGTLLGHAIIVEEIGKHRPITFVVGVRPDGTVSDVAVMAYREAYGGEIRQKRFLVQYRDKHPVTGLRTPGDIKNIAGATLSVEAANRAVRKACAVASLELTPAETP